MQTGLSNILFIVVVFAAMWFLLIRPQQKRAKAQTEMLAKLREGAEIVTIGGIYGTIVDLGEERVRIRIADGSEMEIARRAVSSVVPRTELEELEAMESGGADATHAIDEAPSDHESGDDAVTVADAKNRMPVPPDVRVTLEVVQNDAELKAFMEMGDAYLGAIGYTEHGVRHANLTAHISGNVLHRLGYEDHVVEIASIAGFMHDIGNCVSRDSHWISSAFIARAALARLGMGYPDIAMVMNAVGNHEEDASDPATPAAAAVVLADKADVHQTRVRNTDPSTYDIHDRVNHASKRSFLRVDSESRMLTLEIEIDITEIRLMEYFEIFLERMQLCRRAAAVLSAEFSLVINGTKLL